MIDNARQPERATQKRGIVLFRDEQGMMQELLTERIRLV